MPDYNEKIEVAANRFNIARGDLDYLIAHEGSPGVAQMLSAGDDYDYFGSLAAHECNLASLTKVTDTDSFIDACMGLREYGYNDPTVVEKVKAAIAQISGEEALMEMIAPIEDRDELLDTILNCYGVGDQCRGIWQMDGSMSFLIPHRMLRDAA